MTFDEAVKLLQVDRETIYWSDAERHLINNVINRLKEEYAPKIEMTKEQYEIFKTALKHTSEHSGDFIYFIDILEGESSFSNDEFKEELVFFINNSKKLMQAWLHPETIKVVEE